MRRIQMIVLWMMAAIAIVCADIDTGHCCTSDQPIIYIDKTYKCWDIGKNTTSLLLLPGCEVNETTSLSAKKYNFSLNDAAQLVIVNSPNHVVKHNSDRYCAGKFAPYRNTSAAYGLAVVCNPKEPNITRETYAYFEIVSCILLLITALVYIALPELRDVQGKSIISFCLSLAIGVTLMVILMLMSYETNDGYCAARGFFAYYFRVASFFWMNAISIQILVSIRRPTVLNYGWKEFIYYAVYSWGCPAILTIAMAIVNFMPGDHLKPGIGLNHCWFFTIIQMWYWMFSVMTTLILINIVIFIYISFHLWRESISSDHVKALRYKLVMTFRLAVVMGVTWIFEMIGTLAPDHILWEILSVLINCLHGLWVFLVLVVFRRRVIKAMHKHGWLDCISGPVERYLAVGEDEEDVVKHTIGVLS